MSECPQKSWNGKAQKCYMAHFVCVCVCLRCNCTSLVWREAEVRDEFGGSHLDDHEQPWVQIAGFGVPPTHALPKTVSTMEGSGAGNRF